VIGKADKSHSQRQEYFFKKQFQIFLKSHYIFTISVLLTALCDFLNFLQRFSEVKKYKNQMSANGAI
jgi:hypothetical protein